MLCCVRAAQQLSAHILVVLTGSASNSLTPAPSSHTPTPNLPTAPSCVPRGQQDDPFIQASLQVVPCSPLCTTISQTRTQARTFSGSHTSQLRIASLGLSRRCRPRPSGRIDALLRSQAHAAPSCSTAWYIHPCPRADRAEQGQGQGW